MMPDLLKFDPHPIAESDLPDLRAALRCEKLDWSSGDILLDATRLLGEVTALDADITNCSPVIPTAELTRIRNNVLNQFNALRNNWSNVGASLNSEGVVAQYRAVYAAMEKDSYCHFASDAHLVRDIQNAGDGANQILDRAFSQFAANFAARMPSVRSYYNQLQSAASSASEDVEPVINAYKAFWNTEFDWKLHTGLNATLDNLIAEYNRLFTGSNTLFDQGTNRVQNNFEAAVRQSNVVHAGFGNAYDHWNTVDGAMGYSLYVDNMRMYDDELNKLGRFRFLDTAHNRQIVAEIRQRIAGVKAQFAKFPNFIPSQPSHGFTLDPGTSSLKFFSRQLTLNIAQGAGAHFTTTIAPGKSLIGTGFSYQRGGKMPPHSEHKDGRDCDLFSVYFRVGGGQYDEQKSIAMATWLLQAGVSRLIYTNPTVIRAANAAVPGNAVAVAGSGHETHLHFDVNQAD